MSFTLAALLRYSESVPPGAREALRAAYDAPEEQRAVHLQSAARILYRDAELDCRDARELVGLGDGKDDYSCGDFVD